MICTRHTSSCGQEGLPQKGKQRSSEMDTDVNVVNTALVVVLGILLLLLRRLFERKRDSIPWARGSVPVLGHSLVFRKDPSEFLRKQRSLLGPVFRIQLAGTSCVVVPPSRRVLCASEREVSARRAQAAAGLEECLGHFNIHVGPDFHRQVIKEGVSGISVESIDKNLVESGELFSILGKCMLRLQVDSYLGESFLRGHSGFIDEFASFQSDLENSATTILPRPIALVLYFRPLAARRRKLADTIKDSLFQGNGPWSAAFQAHNLSKEDAANLAIGLLSSSHSNQPIAAAQTFLFLKDNDAARQEACQVVEQHLPLSEAKTIRAGCLETLRIVSLSLGSLREVCVDRLEVSPGVYVSRGERIAVSHSLANTDPAVWGPDALSFNLDKPIGLLESRIHTFSGGTHQCPGRKLAMDHIEATVAVLLYRLHRGKMTIDTRKLPPVAFDGATLARRGGPVPVSFSHND